MAKLQKVFEDQFGAKLRWWPTKNTYENNKQHSTKNIRTNVALLTIKQKECLWEGINTFMACIN
jgi:hypothetical protein